MMMMMMMMMDINSRKLLKNFDVDGEPSKRFTKAEVLYFLCFNLFFIFSLFSNYKHLLLITENEIILSRRGAHLGKLILCTWGF